MRINNYTTRDYTELGRTYQLVLPLSLEGLVSNDNSVRLLNHELEDLDYTKLYQAYSARGRNPAVDPKTMFKILTYTYSQNIYSSRKIETACKRDVVVSRTKSAGSQYHCPVPFRFLGFNYPSVTADSGYESEEGYSYLREEGQQPYIKPQTYEKWKKRSFKQDISKRENMGYDQESDTYICHAGKELRVIYLKKQRSKSGYESEVTVYECEDCTGCPYKEKCTKA